MFEEIKELFQRVTFQLYELEHFMFFNDMNMSIVFIIQAFQSRTAHLEGRFQLSFAQHLK